MITNRTLRNEISMKVDDEWPNTLDCWCQCRKAHDCEACCTHGSGLQHSVYDPHTDRYRFDDLVAYIQDEKAQPVDHTVGTIQLCVGDRAISHFKMISTVRRNQV